MEYLDKDLILFELCSVHFQFVRRTRQAGLFILDFQSSVHFLVCAQR